MTSIRAFSDADYPRLIEIHNQAFPEDQFAENELRYVDDAWDQNRYFRYRVVADESGQVIGFGGIRHMPGHFHPDKYSLGITVDPAKRRQGLGGAIYDRLAATLSERGAIAVRTSAQESDPDSVRFVTNRGFVEARRAWQSRLDVGSFDPAPFAGAMARIANQGIAVTTLADESAVNQRILADVYEVDLICSRDVPDIDPNTDVPYDDFLKRVINAPNAVPDAFFLAKHGDRYVGMARLSLSEKESDVLFHALTGVIPEYRGQGIAMALKLAIVEYARTRGTREIRTWNDTLNRAMLRINEALGFVKKPAEIVYLKELTTAA